MRDVSAGFLDALRGSHAARFRVKVCEEWQEGAEPAGEVIDVVSGDVTMDASSEIRSTVDLVLPGPWPQTATDLVTPYGNELYLERGLVIGGTTVEWVGLGYHRIDAVEQSTVPTGSLRVSGSDRMAGVRDGRLATPIAFPAGTTRSDMLYDLVSEIYPEVTVYWDGDDDTELTSTIVVEEDRYAACNDLVTAAGKIWYWNYDGTLWVMDPPDPSVAAWDVNGGANGVLVSLGRAIRRDAVYNGVVVRGEQTDGNPSVMAMAVIEDEASPVVWGGTFGKVPKFFSSPLITTVEQAEKAAASLLLQCGGLPMELDFTAVPNPALEPLDAVAVTAPTQSTVVHVVESLTIAMSHDAAMTGKTRALATY